MILLLERYFCCDERRLSVMLDVLGVEGVRALRKTETGGETDSLIC